MRISDWSSDVCSSDLRTGVGQHGTRQPGRFDPPAATGENADCPPVHIQLMTLPDQPPSNPQPDAASLRLSVAPMMDWTDTHCRVFHRLLAPHARLYTEMVHANAVIHGARDRLLAMAPVEPQVARQLCVRRTGRGRGGRRRVG